MKRILTLTLFVFSMFYALAQTDGITYQAVIIAPEDLELPGVDSPGNYLPNTAIAIRFTIYDSTNQLEFQEVQYTETDEFGRINLLIGDGDHDYFKEMNWDGTPKDLKVEIDFEAGSNFEEMSRERLTFLPFAYHRNIRATQDLLVEGNTKLEGELEVELPTQLNSSLDVTNDTNLGGILNVTGDTNLNSAFNVLNGSLSNLTGDLTVGGNSALNGTLDVLGLTTLSDLTVSGTAGFGDLTANTLRVYDETIITGSIFMESTTGSMYLKGDGATDTGLGRHRHAVIIDANTHGLAIEVEGSRSNATNFITFYDTDEEDRVWGRIEGERISEFTNNADYNFDQIGLAYDIADGVLDGVFALFGLYQATSGTAMALTSATPCFGLGQCITLPIPSMIGKYTTETVVAGLQLVTALGATALASYNKITYDNNREDLEGVTYASGSGDYAEYLLRLDINEKMTYGDIVGVRAGKITKNTENAERVMVISLKPIVLGNMPRKNREHEYEKVAFMGQVPVKVFGKVNKGDYIIPGGKNNGIGVAISPDKITLKDINNIVGTAWNESEETMGLNLINIVVGVNRNDNNHIVEKLDNKVTKQQEEINVLKDQINTILETLSKIDNSESVQITHVDGDSIAEHEDRKYEIVESAENDIIYFEITKKDIEKVLVNIDDVMRDAGLYEANKEVLSKIKTDKNFRNDFINQMHIKLQKQIHTHKKMDKSSRN